MNALVTMFAATALSASAWVHAQGGGPGPGPSAGSGTAGSGPGPGAGARAAQAPAERPATPARHARGPKLDEANTPGWSMMSTRERAAHHAAMGATQSYDECHALAMQHHAQMKERAQAQGRTLRAEPRRDPCDFLKK